MRMEARFGSNSPARQVASSRNQRPQLQKQILLWHFLHREVPFRRTLQCQSSHEHPPYLHSNPKQYHFVSPFLCFISKRNFLKTIEQRWEFLHPQGQCADKSLEDTSSNTETRTLQECRTYAQYVDTEIAELMSTRSLKDSGTYYEGVSQFNIFLPSFDICITEWARQAVNWNISPPLRFCQALFVSSHQITNIQVWLVSWLMSFLHLLQLSAKAVLICEQVMLMDSWVPIVLL